MASLYIWVWRVSPPPPSVFKYSICDTPYLFPRMLTKHFIEKIGYKMVLRQPTSRQQVGTLYEMTSPSSLWNASPQTTRVQKHAARHRATTQSFRLSTNARARVKHARASWRNPDSTNASEPRFQPEVWRHNEEQERGDTTWENQWGKWYKMKNVTFMVCKQEKIAFVP